MKDIFNIFLSEHNEEKWLNSLGAQGWLLKCKRPFVYSFEKTDKPVVYHIDYLADSPYTDVNRAYMKDKSVCAVKGNSAYVVSGAHGECSLRRQAKRYETLAVFFTVLSVLFFALAMYNVYYMNFFNEIGYTVPANSNEILPMFNFVVGKNPAELFLFVVAAVFAVMCAYAITFTREWLIWDKDLKKFKKDHAAEVENAVSGKA